MSRSNIKDITIIQKMQVMCEEDCTPELFEMWEKLKDHLMKVRKNLRHQTQFPPHCTHGYNGLCPVCDAKQTPPSDIIVMANKK